MRKTREHLARKVAGVSILVLRVCLFLLLLCSPRVLADNAEQAQPSDSEKTDFIRLIEDESEARLQTAVTRYQKGSVSVDLIGAVHIADAAYYERLNTLFDQYPVVLFEMVGGEHLNQTRLKNTSENKREKQEEDEAQNSKKMVYFLLNYLYKTLSETLDLTEQKTGIDYQKKQLVHADLTMKEFQKLQEQRKESFWSFMFQNARKQMKTTSEPPPLDLKKLWTALVQKDSSFLKLQLVQSLAEGDEQISSLAGQSVIITDRNQRCLDVMEKQIQNGHQTIGIFYGAAHFPDMEEKLQAQGFKKMQQHWLTAWEIPKPQ